MKKRKGSKAGLEVVEVTTTRKEVQKMNPELAAKERAEKAAKKSANPLNKWQSHLKKVRKANPKLSYKQALAKAKKSY